MVTLFILGLHPNFAAGTVYIIQSHCVLQCRELSQPHTHMHMQDMQNYVSSTC